MDGAIDLKLVMTLGGILFSVAGASAVAKMQIRQLSDECKELAALIRGLDARYDKLHTLSETQEQRIDVLAKMNSVDKLEQVVDSSVWPLPTYADMLFSR